MGTTIKLYYVDRNILYKEWELIPSKLLVVEDIASYLFGKSALTLNNMQYQKNKLEMGLNIDLGQSYSQPKATTSFKYVSIQNEGELIHYYFVKEAEWRSKSCVRFELVMDVLNTFEENKDYNFKANTRIIREHKDRFTKLPLYITLAIDSVSSSAGSLAVNDTISLSAEVQGDWVLIIPSASIVSISAESLKLKVETYNLVEIKTKIDYSIQYNDLFQISKDPSNYKELYFSNADYSDTYVRKIDFVSEGINPILIRNIDENLIEESGVLGQNWYLLYRNQNDPSDSLVNPVDCYLIPEETTKTNSAYIQGGRLVPSFIESGKYYYFRVSSGQATLSNGQVITYTGSGRYCIVVSKDDNNRLSVVGIYDDQYGDTPPYTTYYFTDIEFIDFTSLPVKYIVQNSFKSTYGSPSYYDFIGTFNLDFNNSGSYNDIDGVSEVDRTDAKNIKLIKLPYCPYDFNVSGDTILTDGNADWDYAQITQIGGGVLHALKLKNQNTTLENNINTSFNPFSNLRKTIETISLTASRKPISDELESKLFHSDFYSPTYVYDSFALQVNLEKCDSDYYLSNFNNNIKFTMTSTINSKFLFTFTDYKCNKNESNFYNVIPVARNNEEVLYNVPYINYIRTGFNYDIKNKNMQNAGNVIGLGLSLGSMAVSFALPSVPLKIAGIVAGVVSMAMSVKNTITSAISNENSIRAKQEQYKNQATSVMGSDDVDLMSEYCGNRLRYYVYKPTEVMINLLNDLFFYAGYSSNRMGLPSHNTRVNFDYLECEASLECISSIPQDCLEELINCFKTGITYLHKTNRASKKWDFAQEFENWEKSLM